MKSRVASLEHVHFKSKSKKIDAKPWFLLSFCLIVSFLLLLNKQFIYLAVMLVISSLYCIVAIPSKVILEFGDEFLLIYDQLDKRDCSIIYYDEIENYRWISRKKTDQLVIILHDGTEKITDCIQKQKVLALLKQKTFVFRK